MKDGLITARAALLTLKAKGSTSIDDGIAKINTMLNDYYNSIQIIFDKNTDSYLAMRGSFKSFSESKFGVGTTPELAEQNLLWKEIYEQN